MVAMVAAMKDLARKTILNMKNFRFNEETVRLTRLRVQRGTDWVKLGVRPAEETTAADQVLYTPIVFR